MRDKQKTPIMNTELMKALNGMSLEELRMINSYVVGLIKDERREKAYEVKSELKVGMVVSVNHPKLMGKQLRVEKINRTKASLKLLNGFAGYNVPLSLIEVIK
jgi:transcription antitermination factor NusG